MASSNSYRINVSAESIEIPDDQTLLHPQFSIVFNVVREYYSDTKTTTSGLNKTITQQIQVPTHYLLSDEGNSIISILLTRSDLIPFSLKPLYWKDLPLIDRNHLVMKILDAIGDMVRAGSGSGRKKLGMRVTIEKRSVVPHRRYEELLEVGQRPRSSTLPPLLFDYSAMRRFRRVLLRVFESNQSQRASRQSAATAVFRSVPAAKSSVEALERLRYEYDVVGSSGDDDESKSKEDQVMTCAVCLDKVLSGAQLTRMPCSHLFHEDCILKWLWTSHSCPLCRLELPTADV